MQQMEATGIHGNGPRVGTRAREPSPCCLSSASGHDQSRCLQPESEWTCEFRPEKWDLFKQIETKVSQVAKIHFGVQE